MRQPSISIALATYNGERFLLEQLNSLARQTYLPCELQIGDDGSTDRTEEIVRQFAVDAPFLVVFHKNHKTLGYGENFLRTAARCKGDWIAFCDQDDVWLPEKLRFVALAIEDAPNDLTLVVHNALLLDNAGNVHKSSFLSEFEDHIFQSLELPAAWLCAGFRQTFRRDLITSFDSAERIGAIYRAPETNTGFDPKPHDSWVPFLANVTGAIKTLSANLVHYRRHSSNATIISGPGKSVRTFANNSGEYRYQAQWHAKAATALLKSAVCMMPSRIEVALDRLALESGWLEKRAAIYESTTLATRLTLLTSLILSGGYGRSWSIRRKSFFKDFVYAFAGRFIREPGSGR